MNQTENLESGGAWMGREAALRDCGVASEEARRGPPIGIRDFDQNLVTSIATNKEGGGSQNLVTSIATNKDLPTATVAGADAQAVLAAKSSRSSHRTAGPLSAFSAPSFEEEGEFNRKEREERKEGIEFTEQRAVPGSIPEQAISCAGREGNGECARSAYVEEGCAGQPVSGRAASSSDFPEGTRAEDVAEALERARLCREFLALTRPEGKEPPHPTLSPSGEGMMRGHGQEGPPLPTLSPSGEGIGNGEGKEPPHPSPSGRAPSPSGEGIAHSAGAMSGNQAALVLGRAASWFSVMVPRFLREGAAGLLPGRRECGRKPSEEAALLTDEDVKRIRFILLRSNRAGARTRNPGSKRFAVLAYARMAECPEELRAVITRRHLAGRPVLPPSALARIQVSRAAFAQFRNGSSAALDFLQSPGSAMWVEEYEEGATSPYPSGGETTSPNPLPQRRGNGNGTRRFIRAGEVMEADDATINFCAVVPWEMGGCPCSEKYGVKVARFQFLAVVDVGSRKVLGYTYVCRPKSSYRAEDVVTLMNAVGRKWGEPDYWRFERGVWESNAVRRRVSYGGSRLWTVYSPHAKACVEGFFGKAWTLLSLEKGQVGRFQGEMEKENEYLTACQRGARNPLEYFLPLKDVLGAIDGAIEWHDSSPIVSDHYGTWVPNERWERHQAVKPNRRLEAEVEWLAAPCVRDWTVKGNTVGGQVRLFDGCSVPFNFAADWLVHLQGVKVRAHFDPSGGRCTAMLCLAENHAGRAAGEVLGTARLVDECASYARLVMAWGDDDRGAGRKAAASAQRAMRREVRVLAHGHSAHSAGARDEGHRSTEISDGLGRSVKVETGKEPPHPTLSPSGEGIGEGDFKREEHKDEVCTNRIVECEEFERRNALDFV